MIGSMVVCLGLLLAAEAPVEVHKEYEAARSKVGRDADAQVKLALWCEAHGLTTERLRHLALAILADPQHAAARGLLGFVKDGDAWRRAERVKADADEAAALAEYNDRRSRAKQNPDDQWALAIWCEEHGLKAEATAHFAAVTQLDPRREAAWKRLGYRKHDGRWMTDAQVAAAKADAEAQKRADKHWRPRLESLRDALRDPKRQEAAEAELATIDDPRAAPMVWKVFGTGKEPDQARAVQLLGQIDSMTASRALAMLGVYSPSAQVRRTSAETLRWRDPREYAGDLVALVHDPIKYEVKPVAGPGSRGMLFIEGEQYNLRRVYDAPAPPALSRLFGDAVPFDPFTGSSYEMAPGDLAELSNAVANEQARNAGQPATRLRASTPTILRTNRQGAGVAIDPYAAAVRRDLEIGANLVESQRAAASTQTRLEADVAEIEGCNRQIHASNDRVLPILAALNGKDLGEDRIAWQRWWVDTQGFASRVSPQRKPTFDQVVPTATPAFAGIQSAGECFAAGTPVRVLDGSKPIEQVRPGDRVLSQDPADGSLAYRPVLAVFFNGPLETLKVRVGDESIVCTTYHRFWRPGKGWAMARELKPGESVRTVGGVAKVEAVEPDQVRPVFNLEVADAHSYFVGDAGALVHDNSVPALRVEPFDRPE